MILRHNTIEMFGYDPFSDDARGSYKVVVRRDCCGLQMVMLRKDVDKYPECDTCSYQRRKAERRQQRNVVRAGFTTQRKLVHGQWVDVKVYPTGAPADFVPKILDEISAMGLA